MKKNSLLPPTLANEAQDSIDWDAFKKDNDKKRLLPDIFYLRWELELLCALLAVIVLLVLPDWLNNKVNIFLSGYNTSMGNSWITFTCNVLLSGFIGYIIIRIFWIYFIRRIANVSSSKIHLARAADHLAEIIFSACLIILMLLLLVSLIQFFGALLKNTVSDKFKNATGINR